MSYISSPPEYYSPYYSPAPDPDDGYSESPRDGPSDISTSSSSGLSAGVIVGIVVGSVAAAFLVCFSVWYIWMRERMNKAEAFEHKASDVPPQDNTPNNTANLAVHTPTEEISSYSSAPMSDSSFPDRPPPPVPPRMKFGLSQSTFTFEELERATAGFSDENFLGQGGFGYVHRGVLGNGKVVAVKQLKAGSAQGEREFQAEVEVISHIHHRHLVSLVGFCISGNRRLLVYEFVQNKTMEFHLHGRGRPVMSWAIRMKIAQGSAKGLTYLHQDCQPKIIHRDIKSANILIDHEFEAKVADFGLAKFFLDTETHVSTRIMGTFGYLAPEYGASGKLTDKSDVFSFGVVLLELITGRRPIDKNLGSADNSLVEWARPLLREALETGDFESVVDLRLQNEYNSIEVKRLIACASACVRYSAPLRPRMSQIIRALEGNISLDELNDEVKPGHSSASAGVPSGSGDNKKSEHGKDMETK